MNTASIQTTLFELGVEREKALALLAADGPTMEMEKFNALHDRIKDIDARCARMKPLAEDDKPAPQPFALGMDAKEASRWSMTKAIAAIATGSWNKEPSLEREASETIAKRLGKAPRGFYVPHDVGQNWLAPKAAQRSTNDPAGGYLVPDTLRANDFIEMLRARLAVYRGGAGATILAGLVGDQTMPRRASGATPGWVEEGTGINGVATPSENVFEAVTLKPKTVTAAVIISRNMLMNSTPDIENLVRDDMLWQLSSSIDTAALNGSGAAGQPAGLLLAATAIAQIDAGGDATVPTWADIVELESLVSEANADAGRLGYLTHPAVRGYLKSNPKVATNDTMMWGEGSMLNGYGATVTSQCPGALTQGAVVTACALIFGNWADLIVGLWGGLDITVDTSTYVLSGAVQAVAFQSCDVAVRHPLSFAWKACARA